MCPLHFLLHVSQWITAPSLFLLGYEELWHVSAVISQPGLDVFVIFGMNSLHGLQQEYLLMGVGKTKDMFGY